MGPCRTQGKTQVSWLHSSCPQSPGSSRFAGEGCTKGPQGWWGTYGPDSTLMERILRKPRSMMLGHSMRNSQRLPWKLSSSHTVILYCPRVSMASLLVMRVTQLLAEPHTSPRAGAHHQPTATSLPATKPEMLVVLSSHILCHRPLTLPGGHGGCIPFPFPWCWVLDLCPVPLKLQGALVMPHLSK